MKDEKDQPAKVQPPEKPKPRGDVREKTEGTWAHLVRVRLRASRSER